MHKATPLPSIEYLRSMFSYEPETGVIRWIVDKCSTARKGSIAGTIDQLGYRRLRLDYQQYSAHRVAWFMHYGKEPSMDLDHVNHDPSDNRISNLRLATNSQNMFNRRPTGRLRGVSFSKHKASNPWRATIQEGGKQISLGYYPTQELAHAAYREAARRIAAEFTAQTD